MAKRHFIYYHIFLSRKKWWIECLALALVGICFLKTAGNVTLTVFQYDEDAAFKGKTTRETLNAAKERSLYFKLICKTHFNLACFGLIEIGARFPIFPAIQYTSCQQLVHCDHSRLHNSMFTPQFNLIVCNALIALYFVSRNIALHEVTFWVC